MGIPKMSRCCKTVFLMDSLQVSELCVMLEKYRSENQRIVLQKDRDIETLQQHVSKEEKSKVSMLIVYNYSGYF